MRCFNEMNCGHITELTLHMVLGLDIMIQEWLGHAVTNRSCKKPNKCGVKEKLNFLHI
jgi:hypothetical protein